MNRRETEKIKAAAKEIDARKARRKKAGLKLLKQIAVGGLSCLGWTFTMLLVIIIVHDIDAGTQMFTTINSYLYMLYATLVGIGIFIYLVEHILPKRRKDSEEIIVEDPADYRYKN